MPEGDKGQNEQIPEGLYIQFRQPSGAYGCTREGARGKENRKDGKYNFIKKICDISDDP